MNLSPVTCVTQAAGKEAAFFREKNGGSSSAFDIHPIDTKIYVVDLDDQASRQWVVRLLILFSMALWWT